MKNLMRALYLVLCVAIVLGASPALVLASDVEEAGKPISYDATGTAQPVTSDGYSPRIDEVLLQALRQSNKSAISVKNTYFATETDRERGIMKTDIVIMGELPANTVDVLFVSDVSGSMSMFPEDTAVHSAYCCSCCNSAHMYRIPAGFTYKEHTLNTSGKDIFFTLEQFADAGSKVGYSLVGYSWNEMPWAAMFEDLRMNWPSDMNAVDFINAWKPTDQHYSRDNNGFIDRIYPPTVPADAATSQATYYSPDESFRSSNGCEDKMSISREWIAKISKRILDCSPDSHIGLVDFAGNYVRSSSAQGSFTSTMQNIEAFLSATAGYDETHYHLGLNKATEFIEEHYLETTPCDHFLYTVFITDGMPDYGTDYSTAETNVNLSIGGFQAALKQIVDGTTVWEPGKGAQVYAVGIGVPQSAAWPPDSEGPRTPDQTIAYWLKAIAGQYGSFRNCASVSDFKAFMGEIYDSVANAITGVMHDKLGGEFSLLVNEDHPVVLLDHYDDASETYDDEDFLPTYIRYNADDKTIELDVDYLAIVPKYQQIALSGMHLQFYTQMSENALDANFSGARQYSTNDGDATMTYLDNDGREQTITMPSPYVRIVGVSEPDPDPEPVAPKPNVPKTGDSARVGQWLAICAASLAAIFALCVRRKRAGSRT